ncbi:MAG: class I SAM-dependent methyltransferase [Desulfobacteraceae bacterium]|nr:class I SAM-dependent methyltransferase [Desulfobacteraceae bacterium]
MPINEWRTFFNDCYAPEYKKECFTQNTDEEVRFLFRELKLPAGSRILDVGCGTGRHSVALAEKGFCVTGVDISVHMLREAQKAASEADVQVHFIVADAQFMSFSEEFDAAISICEGALSLLGSGDNPFNHDQRILQNIFNSLKPGSIFISTVLNAFRRIRQMSEKDVLSGQFDPVTMVEVTNEKVKTKQGQREIYVRERLYTPPEYIRMLRQAGFVAEDVFGGTAGTWDRQPLKLDEMEFMVIAEKP